MSWLSWQRGGSLPQHEHLPCACHLGPLSRLAFFALVDPSHALFPIRARSGCLGISPPLFSHRQSHSLAAAQQGFCLHRRGSPRFRHLTVLARPCEPIRDDSASRRCRAQLQCARCRDHRAGSGAVIMSSMWPAFVFSIARPHHVAPANRTRCGACG